MTNSSNYKRSQSMRNRDISKSNVRNLQRNRRGSVVSGEKSSFPSNSERNQYDDKVTKGNVLRANVKKNGLKQFKEDEISGSHHSSIK